MSDIRPTVGEICENAYRTALLLRQTKTEYLWMQKGKLPRPNDSNFIIVASGGAKTLHDTKDVRIVFGGVSKAKEHILFQSECLIGPFR